MIKLHLCVSAACDTCREDATDADGVAIYFDATDPAHTVTDALTELDWRVEPGGQLTCPQCLANAACLAHGHVLSPWTPCRCRGINHPTGPDGRCGFEHRYCDRCTTHHRETRPANPNRRTA